MSLEPVGTLGLRGAGLRTVRIAENTKIGNGMGVDSDRIRRIWTILSAADLASIAHGMADQLCRRAVTHATSRVQFPGLFHDEAARDSIGKFGAVKKMIAEMATSRYVIETLDHTLSPVDFSSTSVERACLIKAVVAEVLGTAPGSLSYNAGQVFGGTGYSEDDILAKLYRDAAAWRFLGAPNAEVFLIHGGELLRTWRADGRRLAILREEAQLFEEVAQRKALQAELDGVRVLRSRLRGLVSEWQAAQRTLPSVFDPTVASAAPDVRTEPWAAAEISERLGRQDSLLLVSKALLLRTHARLERGLPSEIETVLVRVWLDHALAALDQFDSLVRTRLEDATRRPDRPLVEPTAGPPVTRYADFLAAPLPYDSGDFLLKAVDLTEPHYVPEMNETDPDLAGFNQEVQTLLREYFGPLRDGLVYERYIERQHRPDAADLDFCRRHGFFRMPIPRELGGEGRRKADYYLVTTNAQRLVDVAVSLTIQANSSIGTTPVLLARDKDLPKAQKDLGPFVGDASLQHEIQDGLQKLLSLLNGADTHKIEPAYRALNQRLASTVFARAALKTLAHPFVECWQQAGRAGLDFDMSAMRTHVQEALAAWKEACAQAPEFHAELARRREACDLFLRWVASGQISAFALTEPSAGSDTARVATRARLRSVPVEIEPDGVVRFVPEGDRGYRYLLDARKLEFRPEGVCYRGSAEAEPALIHFEEYDYETDDPHRMRFYDHGSRRVYFTDIAQLRERDGRLWYDYFELTGAKMWITNGRMAGIMCLYAKTEEGVTGFIVDRHAEGLIVGKDEEKLGQCGSPTNELSLQQVRVPRENVLGLEGRGQVNALETLNVGRAGLAMSAMAQIPGLIVTSRDFAQRAYGQIPDWVAWRLRRMEEDCFIAEALAHDVIGRFEHSQTRSVRMESAISKMLVSELLHQVIETAEEIHGLQGQTNRHLVEKRKRDARILNIYEGTNEVQRFTILKDLATEVGPRWRQAPEHLAPNHLSREVLELEALKTGVRQRIDAALELFGQELWQNPNLQANCFLLAEAVAWLAAAESTLGRLTWLIRQNPVDETSDPPAQVDLGRRALARCGREGQSRLRRFDEDLAHLRRGFYAPEIRAAALLFDTRMHPAVVSPEAKIGQEELGPHGGIRRPFSVLVVVEPSAGGVPNPYVVKGRLCEPHLTLHEGDRSALETALRLRDGASAPVSITVAAVGPRCLVPALREILSLGIESVRLLTTEADAVAPDSAASALASVLRSDGPFDLVLTGTSGPGGEEGLVGKLTAEALAVPFAGNAVQLAVQAAADDSSVAFLTTDQHKRVRALPAAVAMEAGLPLRAFTTAGYLAGLNKAIDLVRWPRKIEARQVMFVEPKPKAPVHAGEQAPSTLAPRDAGRWILRELGLTGQQCATLEPFTGLIHDVDHPAFHRMDDGTSWILAVVATDSSGRLRSSAESTVQAARLIARNEEDAVTPLVALVVPTQEQLQRQALAQLRLGYQGDVLVIPLGSADAADEVRCRLLAEGLAQLEKLPLAVVGEPWTESAFARLAERAGRTDEVAARVQALGAESGQVVLETNRAKGKLRVRQLRALPAGHTFWITLAEEAEVAEPAPERVLPTFRVERWKPHLERVYAGGEIQQLLNELKHETGLVTLADAEFIVDVGFGVGNRDGYEAVIEPLERALLDLGVKNLVIGGSRKVTEELHLLPAERQIGQSGVSVNPRILLAIGISGAPQHINYIGSRAKIVAFNRDPEAPLMTLNQRQAQPRDYPIVGDLFTTVPELVAVLQKEAASQASQAETVAAQPA
jgi:alkylation response protein AidB-like acyl-CoA dehydrogenase/electron transfer flavoprotein alpha subunit